MAMRRIMDSDPAGIDLDRLEAFCQSARANGADGADVVGVRATWRGGMRAVWIDVPVDDDHRAIEGGRGVVPPPATEPGADPAQDC